MSKVKAIVFGRGQYFKYKLESIKKDYEIIGFLDNKPSAQFGIDKVEDLPVRHPNDLGVFDGDSVILLMASNTAFIDMAYQLLDLGIDSKRIIFGLSIAPCFDRGEQILIDNSYELRILNRKIYLECGSLKIHIKNASDYGEELIRISEENNALIDALKKMNCEPYSRRFGHEFGTPIDRYYIEKFLEDNKHVICGDVMEIGDDTYIRRFGHDITNKMILHVNGWNGAIKGNLATGEGIEEGMVDCLICTQTIQMIFDIESAMSNIYKLLKPNGTALITIHGISQVSIGDYNNWGEYWRITSKTMQEMASHVGFKNEGIKVESYGNIKTVMCHIYGMCQEQLLEEDFMYNDNQFPLVVTAVLRK